MNFSTIKAIRNFEELGFATNVSTLTKDEQEDLVYNVLAIHVDRYGNPTAMLLGCTDYCPNLKLAGRLFVVYGSECYRY